MIIGLQIIGVAFSFFMIYLSVLHYKRKEINGMEFYSWATIWVLTIFTIIFPDILRTFASNFFITRLFDLMVVVALVLVITMVARSYVSTRRFENKLEELIESLSTINSYKKKK